HRDVVECQPTGYRDAALDRADDSVRRNERLLRLVMDAIPVGVVVMSQAGDILLGNPASSRIWAGMLTDADARYSKSKGWWHETGRPIEADEWASVRARLKGEISVNEVIDIEAFDGTRKTIQNSAVPIRDEEGAIVGAV